MTILPEEQLIVALENSPALAAFFEVVVNGSFADKLPHSLMINLGDVLDQYQEYQNEQTL